MVKEQPNGSVFLDRVQIGAQHLFFARLFEIVSVR